MAGTTNSWNNQIAGSYNQIILNAGTNGVAISTDASAATVNVATGGAVKTTTVGSTNSTSATTVQSGSGALNITATNGALTVNSGTGALGISTDASATTVSFATGAAVKGVTLGSTNSTSATTVQSGSGALNVTSTNGALTINSGTGALGISTDASATTVSFATGAAVKGVTLGSTNTTSSTAIKSGTGNVAINSGLTIDSTGRNYNTVQPAFLYNLNSSTSNNVTGDGTTYTVLPATQKFDQGSNFNTGTGTFTAPITGKYQFNWACMVQNIGAGHTTFQLQIKCTNAQYNFSYLSPTAAQASGNFLEMNGSTLANMTAADTALFQVIVAGSTKTIGVHGNTMDGSNQGFTFVSGFLVC